MLAADTFRFQTWWLAFVILGGAFINGWQIWRWRKHRTEMAVSVKVVSTLNFLVAAVVGGSYALDALGVISQATRRNWFLSTMGPFYWPILLYVPVFMFAPKDDPVVKIRELTNREECPV